MINLEQEFVAMEDYIGRMSQIEQPSQEVLQNAEILLQRVNELLHLVVAMEPHLESAKHPAVNSGWRPAAYNAGVPGAAVRSRHITGQAIDLADRDGLDDFLFDHPNLLETCELWCEHPAATKGWVHFQSVPPRSGNRFFYP
ncbi:MAG: hypothetical protein IPM64_17610 [Phycisphaerales bacterium]|nr:hypothetical protein [Phycisphaerales bacterium]